MHALVGILSHAQISLPYHEINDLAHQVEYFFWGGGGGGGVYMYTKFDLIKSHMQYLPGTLHSREAGSGLQVMLVHIALICVPGTNPGLQL